MRNSSVPRFVDLEHHRGDQIGPLRHQRAVGFELLLKLSVAALLDIEHLLDLMPHRFEITTDDLGNQVRIDVL